MPLVSIPLPDLEATDKLAQQIAPLLKGGDILALKGSLGAGKTTFVRMLLRAFGVEGEVPSPTFTLLQIYETKHFPIYHFDLYRLKSEGELDELGWDDVGTDSLLIVEWPERAGSRMPRNHLLLNFSFDQSKEHFCTFEREGAWSLLLAKVFE